MKTIISRIKRLWNLHEEYENLVCRVDARIDKIDKRIGEHTVVHADIHYRGYSQVIVVGQYRNSDYVRVFNVPADGFDKLIEILHQEEKYAKVGRFDMPSHAFPFSAVYERDML